MKKAIFLTGLVISLFSPVFLSGQKVLQIEKPGKVKAQKIFIGTPIAYRLTNSKDFLYGQIEDFNIENNLIVLEDRYIKVSDINALRFQRSWPKAVGTSAFWFGTGWSALAAIGTATDGNPDTHYQWSDAIVTGSSYLLSFSLPKLFGKKTIKTQKRARLRLLDINFQLEK